MEVAFGSHEITRCFLRILTVRCRSNAIRSFDPRQEVKFTRTPCSTAGCEPTASFRHDRSAHGTDADRSASDVVPFYRF